LTIQTFIAFEAIDALIAELALAHFQAVNNVFAVLNGIGVITIIIVVPVKN